MIANGLQEVQWKYQKHIKCNKNRTCVGNKIDEHNHQITTNIDRSLFVNSNKIEKAADLK